jgi:anti-sigma factor RsiW
MNPELEEKLSALLDGELSPAETEALRAELARSPELTARLAALAAVDDGLRVLPSPRVPGDLRARVERRIHEDVAVRRRAPRSGATPGLHRRWLAAAAFAAAAAALLALVVLPQLRREETRVARTEPEPTLPPQLAEQPPAPVPERALEEPAAEDVALADDLPVIEVLDVLAELDELEEVGSG